MQIVETVAQLGDALRISRMGGREVGLVPTMGYLHEGHLSLVRRARRENQVVVVSIFVNPTQFGPSEDLESYPRDWDRDLDLLRAEDVDVTFLPSVEELYPDRYATYVEVEGPLTRTMCGRSRPGHFRGVATIVTKLFNLVRPYRAYFGEKDAQQLGVIRQLTRDLNLDLELVACPTVREPDGLALSSRNSYLSQAERALAPRIYQALLDGRRMIEAGERRGVVLAQHVEAALDAVDGFQVDYVAVVDADSFRELETLKGTVLLAAAVRLGKTRLIDNIRVEVD
jgi:pantoate--beta-alanine ligase